MMRLNFPEHSFFSYIPRVYHRGQRARRIIRARRERHPFIWDHMLGNVPDRRPLPSAWVLGLTLEANRWERRLQFFVERRVSRLSQF